MEPGGQRKAWHRRPWFWAASICVLLGALVAFMRNWKAVEVAAYEVRRQELLVSVASTSTGTIKADQEVRLTAQRLGTITTLHVEEGSVVSAGDEIARLDPDESRQRLLISSATVEKTQASIDSLSYAIRALKESVEADIARSGSVLREADQRHRRFVELRAAGYISEIELDAARREYDVARAGFATAKASREQVRSKEEEMKALTAALEAAKHEKELARINFEYSFVRSPISGIVTARPVKRGDTVAVGTQIAAVVSPESLYIESFIDEADVARIRLGQPVKVTMDAYPGQTFNGQVSMISPVVLGSKQEARTFEVRVRLSETAVTQKPGMSADVEVVVERVGDVLAVPSQAIVDRKEGRHVFLIDHDRARFVPVKTGRFNWSLTEVTEGIRDGDRVVQNPDAPGLADGVRVRDGKRKS